MSKRFRFSSLCLSRHSISDLCPARFSKSYFFKSLSCFSSAFVSHDSADSSNAHGERFRKLNGKFSRQNWVIVNELPLGLDGRERLRKYSSLLHDCVSKAFLVEGKAVHGNLIRCEIELDSYLWVSLVNFYAKSGELDYARKVLVLMPKRDVVSWTALISGYVAEGYGCDGAVLFRDMRRDGIRPNEFALPVCLRACSMCLDVQYSKQVHAEGIKLGFSMDFVFGSCVVDAYVKCSEMEFAKTVFFDMPEKNVVVWNVLLNGYAEMGEEEEVLRLFEEIKNPEIKFNRYTLSTALKGCANSGNAGGGKIVHCLMIRSGYELDHFSSCALINMYSKCGLAKEALIVFKMIQYPDVAIWSSIIACLDQNKKTKEMIDLFGQMRCSGVSPNHFTFATILSASLDYDDQQFGQSIHAFVLKQGFASTNLVGNALVSMYMRNGCVKHGTQVFEEMEVRDLVSWNALLGGFCNSGEGPRIFRLMLAHGVLPTVDTFINVVLSCCSLSSMSLGKQVHAHVIKNCFSSNYKILTVLGDMYAKTGCLADAVMCFDKLVKKDYHCWMVMIKGYAQNYWPEGAVMCFSEMQRSGLQPNEFTLSSCLNAVSSMEALQMGRLLHSVAIKSGSSDEIFICSSLIDMYGKCGCIEDAEAVFKGTVLRDTVTWNALICAYSRYGLGEKAIEALVMMVEDGVWPDEITVNGVLLACHDAQSIEKARRHFRSLPDLYGTTPAIKHRALDDCG